MFFFFLRESGKNGRYLRVYIKRYKIFPIIVSSISYLVRKYYRSMIAKGLRILYIYIYNIFLIQKMSNTC